MIALVCKQKVNIQRKIKNLHTSQNHTEAQERTGWSDRGAYGSKVLNGQLRDGIEIKSSNLEICFTKQIEFRQGGSLFFRVIHVELYVTK